MDTQIPELEQTCADMITEADGELIRWSLSLTPAERLSEGME
jgi:hypothetical protein